MNLGVVDEENLEDRNPIIGGYLVKVPSQSKPILGFSNSLPPYNFSK